MTDVRRTVCNRDCPDACSILATVQSGRVVKLAGDPDHPVTRGFLCYRTNQFLRTQYSSHRLTQPLLKRGDGHVPVGWDEALDLLADRLATIRDESGPASIFHYRSGGTLGMLSTLVDYFFELFGPVTVKRGDICSGAGEAAQTLDFGVSDSHDVFDLRNSNHIILWGKNVRTSSPHLIPILNEARDRGAELVLIDPIHHRTASLCSKYVQPRPGGDFALAMAVARCLFERDFIDADAASYCDGFGEFRDLSFGRSVEHWCRSADVAPSVAHDLARRLGPGRPTAILVGWGMGRRRNGGAIVRALDALGAVSGNLGVEGGGVSFYYQRRGAFDASFDGSRRTPPRTICEPLFGHELESMANPVIRAVWVTAGNPVAMLPDSKRIARALRSRELVVVVDSWMSDTARLADVVLPTTTLLEADDLLGSYGHHYLGVARPVVPPPGGVKSDLEIVQALAGRVGLGDRLAGSARDWKARIIAPKLGPKGVGLDDLESGYVRNPLSPRVLFGNRRFPTRNGRAQLVTEAPPETDDLSDDFPLFILSVSTPKSQSSQWAKDAPSAPIEVTVHPSAAATAANRDVCRLESELGSMLVRVVHDDRQRPDVVIVPKGGHFASGTCANALIEARTTDVGEGGALYEQRARLVPA